MEKEGAARALRKDMCESDPPSFALLHGAGHRRSFVDDGRQPPLSFMATAGRSRWP